MTTADTAKATGPMTLDQGLAHIKANMAASGATTDTQVVNKLNDEGVDITDETEVSLVTDPIEETQTAETEETTEGSADESAAESEEILPAKGKIILPDGSEITAEEARKGYLRQADYTRKSQERAREVEVQNMQFNQQTAQMNALIQNLTSYQEQTPDWVKLSGELSPQEFQQTKTYWEKRQSDLSTAKRVLEYQQAEAAKVQGIKARRALMDSAFEPKWSDEKVLDQDMKTLASYLVEEGIPRENVLQLNDPVVITLGEKARRYDELMKAKPKAALAVVNKPKPTRPGTKTAGNAVSENIRVLNERFLRTRSQADAMALMKAKGAAGLS